MTLLLQVPRSPGWAEGNVHHWRLISGAFVDAAPHHSHVNYSILGSTLGSPV